MVIFIVVVVLFIIKLLLFLLLLVIISSSIVCKYMLRLSLFVRCGTKCASCSHPSAGLLVLCWLLWWYTGKALP